MQTKILLVAASLAFASALRSSKLQPDGHYVSAEHGKPTHFSFAPEAAEHGVEMRSFSIQVWSVGVEPSLVARKDVESAEPFTEMVLEPGRYQWDVQWWSTNGEVAEIAESGVVVAPHADVWDGVPWLGQEGSNEFAANTSWFASSAQRPGGLELMVATLGFGYVTVNGKEISSDLLSYSGWTNTEHRVLYRTYDVSGLIGDDGVVALHVGLGCGYRCDPKNRFPLFKDGEDRSHDTVGRIFRLQLLADARPLFHSGSDGWACRQGPVIEDSVYGGETFRPSAVTPWAPAPALPSGWGPKGKMVAAAFPGVQVTRTDKPVSITKVAQDVHVVDFGSNVAGVCSISVPELLPASDSICAIADEGSDAVLSCAASGNTISKVTFASFGTPAGSCDSGFSQDSCHASSSQAFVEATCLGKTRCSVTASNDGFGGDPCYLTKKQLAVSIECEGPPAPPVTPCRTEQENKALTLSCDVGTISAVNFASFGTASGSCDSGFVIDSSCHSEVSQIKLEQACLGLDSCTVDANVGTFGDPCYGTVKQLVAEVVCGGAPSPSVSVSLKHGELMQHQHLPDVKSPDTSRVYFGNLRSAEATDTLVLTSPIKDWMPRFTYHGFRYVEVHGYPGELAKDSIKRLVMHTAVPDRASATFDDEVLQAIHEGSKGSQRSNLMQVPTDCPQRDERLGWMGDMSLSAQSMLLHFDMGSMASAYVDSMVDEMGSDGSFPDVVPFQRYGGRPADLSWSSAFISTLTSLWQEAGDLDSAKIHWDSVKTHIGNLQAQYSKAGGITHLPEPYGDWCPPPATPGSQNKETPSRGFSAAFSMVRTIQQAADLGEALGGQAAEDAKIYSNLSAVLRNEFHTGFYHSDTKLYDNGAMITSVLPLALGAVPHSEKDAVVQNLLSHITGKNGTWSGGIINNRFLFDVLHDNGHADVALAMLKRRDYPSYGYMYFNEFEPARECMWELPDAPFQGTGMNSRNHHMFSSVGHYLVTRIAGLSRGPGSAELTAIVGSEPRAAATLRTSRGDVEFGWRRDAAGLEVDVMVPVGMRAHLHVPVADSPLRMGSLSAAEFTATERHGKPFASVILASGRHSFTSAASVFV